MSIFSRQHRPSLRSRLVERPTQVTTGWWLGIHVVAVIGLCIRVASVFAFDSIHHPDEIFQYSEQAHRLVFGYGYVPWEYRFGIRSWLVPGFIAIWLFLLKALQIDAPIAYVTIIKILFCILSTSLIYANYVIGKNLASEMAGRLPSSRAFGGNSCISLLSQPRKCWPPTYRLGHWRAPSSTLRSRSLCCLVCWLV